MGQVENDMVLGTAQYNNGTRATVFSPADLGIRYLAGEGDEPRIVRWVHVDNPAAEAIDENARAARELAGMLTGHAVGRTPNRSDKDNAAHDLLTVITLREAKLWGEVASDRLPAYKASNVMAVGVRSTR